MAFKGEQGVVAAHAVAVIDDADELAAAGFDFDADAGGAGVEGVFEQLLNDGCGALDHFAGGDLVGDLVGEDADAAHGSIVGEGGREERPGVIGQIETQRKIGQTSFGLGTLRSPSRRLPERW